MQKFWVGWSVMLGLVCGGGSLNAQSLVNPDFEILENTVGTVGNAGTPLVFNDWSGDNSVIVTGTHQGITPYSGNRMLQFINTSPTPSITASVSSEVHQHYDLAAFADEIAQTNVAVRARFFVNRVVGDAETDDLFFMSLRAMAGEPVNFPSEINHNLMRHTNGIYSDADPLTWEEVVSDLVWLPPGTDYLNVTITALENIRNDNSNPELDGHYADAVGLELLSGGEIEDARLVYTFTWAAAVGKTYQVQSGPTPAGPWLDFGDPVVGDGTSKEVCDTRAGPQQYYRGIEVSSAE